MKSCIQANHEWQQAILTLLHQMPEPGLELGTHESAFSALTTIPRLTAKFDTGTFFLQYCCLLRQLKKMLQAS